MEYLNFTIGARLEAFCLRPKRSGVGPALFCFDTPRARLNARTRRTLRSHLNLTDTAAKNGTAATGNFGNKNLRGPRPLLRRSKLDKEKGGKGKFLLPKTHSPCFPSRRKPNATRKPNPRQLLLRKPLPRGVNLLPSVNREEPPSKQPFVTTYSEANIRRTLRGWVQPKRALIGCLFEEVIAGNVDDVRFLVKRSVNVDLRGQLAAIDTFIKLINIKVTSAIYNKVDTPFLSDGGSAPSSEVPEDTFTLCLSVVVLLRFDL
nr:hypothetical protein HmN_000998600 [Hymenolepis microstoma]